MFSKAARSTSCSRSPAPSVFLWRANALRRLCTCRSPLRYPSFPIPNPPVPSSKTSRPGCRKRVPNFARICAARAGSWKSRARFHDLEASGWKGAEGTAIKCHPHTLAFYNAIATAAAEQGYLSLDFLELSDKPIAAHFAFNFHGRYLLAKAAYDESFRRYGPGQLLVNSVLDETPERSLVEFDFVGPATWDESRWASQRRTSYRVFIFRRTLYGQLLHAARISARDIARRILGRRKEDESKPLELKSKPQGSDNDAAGEA